MASILRSGSLLGLGVLDPLHELKEFGVHWSGLVWYLQVKSGLQGDPISAVLAPIQIPIGMQIKTERRPLSATYRNVLLRLADALLCSTSICDPSRTGFEPAKDASTFSPSASSIVFTRKLSGSWTTTAWANLSRLWDSLGRGTADSFKPSKGTVKAGIVRVE